MRGLRLVHIQSAETEPSNRAEALEDGTEMGLGPPPSAWHRWRGASEDGDARSPSPQELAGEGRGKGRELVKEGDARDDGVEEEGGGEYGEHAVGNRGVDGPQEDDEAGAEEREGDLDEDREEGHELRYHPPLDALQAALPLLRERLRARDRAHAVVELADAALDEHREKRGDEDQREAREQQPVHDRRIAGYVEVRGGKWGIRRAG